MVKWSAHLDSCASSVPLPALDFGGKPADTAAPPDLTAKLNAAFQHTGNHGCRPASLCEKVRARTDCIQRLFTRKLSSASNLLNFHNAIFARLSANAIIPARGSAAAAGYDLSAAKDVIVPAHGKALVPTDLAIKVPDDCYGRVGMFDSNRSTLHLALATLTFMIFFSSHSTAPRSGLSWKHHLDVGAGVIDSDYRGNVGVVLFNHAATDFLSAFRHLPSHIHATNCISHLTLPLLSARQQSKPAIVSPSSSSNAFASSRSRRSPSSTTRRAAPADSVRRASRRSPPNRPARCPSWRTVLTSSRHHNVEPSPSYRAICVQSPTIY